MYPEAALAMVRIGEFQRQLSHPSYRHTVQAHASRRVESRRRRTSARRRIVEVFRVAFRINRPARATEVA